MLLHLFGCRRSCCRRWRSPPLPPPQPPDPPDTQPALCYQPVLAPQAVETALHEGGGDMKFNVTANVNTLMAITAVIAYWRGELPLSPPLPQLLPGQH